MRSSGDAADRAAARDEWAIEFFRGIAAAMVVAARCVPVWRASVGLPAITPFGFAYTGVDLFFVLTGHVFMPTLQSPRFA